ncbi:sporulation protein [Bacillus cereus]|uniref:cell wall hydrolase n=1 Tax=Bacillus cereus TaxID=1396 RepID=UPI000BF2FC4A|nr:cell wall hydrolase [Bacillus cereus]PES55464.1 sporulation protein [Bacillus cereus]
MKLQKRWLLCGLFSLCTLPHIVHAESKEPINHESVKKEPINNVEKTFTQKHTSIEGCEISDEGKDIIEGYMVKKYMPIEGCEVVKPLPVECDINHEKPEPPPPEPAPEVQQTEPQPVQQPEDTTQGTDNVEVPKPEQHIEEQKENQNVEKVDKKVVQEKKQVQKTQAVEQEQISETQLKEKEVSKTTIINKGASIEMTEDERYWLEKLVEAEAADEPYEGKVAVATTIAYRVDDKTEFPDTVMEVIKAPKQYSPWMDGAIYKRTPSEETKRAVAEVFDKGVRNLPKGTVYFYDPRYAPHNWMERTRAYVTTIGNHVFCSIHAK